MRQNAVGQELVPGLNPRGYQYHKYILRGTELVQGITHSSRYKKYRNVFILQSLFTAVVDGQLICVLNSLSVLPIEQQHGQACTRQEDRVEPPMEELELHFTSQGLCDGSPAEHLSAMSHVNLHLTPMFPVFPEAKAHTGLIKPIACASHLRRSETNLLCLCFNNRIMPLWHYNMQAVLPSQQHQINRCSIVCRRAANIK